MRVRRLAAAGTAALLLPLAACSDGDSNADPVDPSTSTNSGTPSPSKTASDGPTLPPEAQGKDQAAAKAFVEFYFELISEAMVTGDTEALRSFSHPKCKSCSQMAKKVDAAYAKGAVIKTKGWEPTKFIAGQGLPKGHEFYVRVTRHPRRLYDGDKFVDRDPHAVLSMRIIVLPKVNGWETAWLDKLT